MARRSKYEQEMDAVRARLRELSHTNAQTVDEAVENGKTISRVFGMAPAGAEAYDYCPTHLTVVRFHGQCHLCEN